MHVAIAILRVQEGLDYTGVIADTDFIEDVTGEDNGAFSLEDCASTSSSTPSSRLLELLQSHLVVHFPPIR